MKSHHFLAIELMLRGVSDRKIAEHPYILARRETVTRWRRHNPLFRQALADRREKVLGIASNQLYHSMNTALATLLQQLHGPDINQRFKAATNILKLAASKGFRPPPEPEVPFDLLHANFTDDDEPAEPAPDVPSPPPRAQDEAQRRKF